MEPPRPTTTTPDTPEQNAYYSKLLREAYQKELDDAWRVKYGNTRTGPSIAGNGDEFEGDYTDQLDARENAGSRIRWAVVFAAWAGAVLAAGALLAGFMLLGILR